MTAPGRPTPAANEPDGGPAVCDGTVTGSARAGLLQIGQVAERTERTELSLRTIRFYEENGLVIPSARSEGGYRLYSDTEVARLEVIQRMKPLGFSLQEMQQLLTLLADLDTAGGGDEGEALLDRLRMFHEAATARVTALREQLTVAEGFAATLTGHLHRTR